MARLSDRQGDAALGGGEPRPRFGLWPLYAAGFTTAFGAHGIAASLGAALFGHGPALWTLGVILALYDGAEIVLKPVFGTVADRVGPRRVLLGGLVAFAFASAAAAVAGTTDTAVLALARLGQDAAVRHGRVAATPPGLRS